MEVLVTLVEAYEAKHYPIAYRPGNPTSIDLPPYPLT